MPSSKTYARYTITAALIYANGPVHIGHLAGCYLPADIYARYLRAAGRDVCFVTGTDEHGVPITLQAHKEGRGPQALVDVYYKQIKASLEDFGISFDMFDRTSTSAHHRLASDFFLALHEKNCFLRQKSQQYYDVKEGLFLADRYIYGQCPGCEYAHAYGDQCESCGRSLSPQELKAPQSIFGGALELRTTENWYLPMARWQKDMETYIAQQQHWKDNVYGQCQSWLQEGLRSRAMTRDLDWGVPVPLPGLQKKVLYVWFEAPLGYITATQKCRPKHWEAYWKDKSTRLVHFIGKDNIVFHCLIFPLMLRLHGDYILPTDVPANEFLNLEGEKLSTSRGWAIWLHEYLKDFPEQIDVLRYVLCARMPETKDSDFTWKAFQAHNNNELVAIFGNFVHRVLHLTQRYTKGEVPAGEALQPQDKATLAEARKQVKALASAIEQFRFRQALMAMMDIARLGNKYLADEAPWAPTQSPGRRETQLYTALQLSAVLAVVSEPFLPFTAQKMRDLLNLEAHSWEDCKQDLLPSGHPLKQPAPLFAKIEDKTIAVQLQKLQKNMKKVTPPSSVGPEAQPTAAEINFEAFAQLDLRVGTVLHCEPVPKSEKLLRFTLDDGERERIILSAMATHYQPDTLIGEQVIFIKNLQPRKIMGEISEGMILSATAGKTLRLLQPDELIAAGAKIG